MQKFNNESFGDEIAALCDIISYASQNMKKYG